ncbi:MAG: peroxidase-related enzyme [Gammaproteobacteria bacterium]|nr:peroxidase-related enzyme [Gammaproteobacteria bacterium]
MPQPPHISRLPVPPESRLDADMRQYFDLCREKLGLLPNVLAALSYKPARLRNFVNTYNEIMLGKDSRLSRLEREMIAVVVSSHNRCYYCLVAHGQAVRELSGDPELGEMLVMNYRVAELPKRQRAMLDYAWKLTATPAEVGEVDRQALRKAGFDDGDIFDIGEVTGLFNLSNRMAMTLDMMPNREYHAMHRVAAPARRSGRRRRG